MMNANQMALRTASVALALCALAAPVFLMSPGCKSSSTAPDQGLVVPDAGGTRACGDVGFFRWSPSQPQATVVADSGTRATLFSVWGASESAVWAVGTEGRVIFYDGNEWKTQQTPTTVTLTAVWGTSDKDVWAVGFDGVLLHFNGTAWKDASPPVDIFYTADGGPPTGDAAAELRRNFWGVWAYASNDQVGTESLFVVGDNGLIAHWDAATNLWTGEIPVTAGGQAIKVQDQLNAVWGVNPNNVFIVGNFGTILKGNAGGFSVQQAAGVTKDLHAVWGRNGSDIYAVGTGGTVLHYRNDSWKEVAGAPKQVLRGVWGPADNSSIVYLVGWDGTLLRLSGGPGFGQGGQFDPYYCIVPGRRLEAIWGSLVPITMFDAYYPPDIGVDGNGDANADAMDAGAPPPDAPSTDAVELVPYAHVVGASGMVITGP